MARIIREEKLDGVVMFADESNMHSMELFDEIQPVNWIGAISVGIPIDESIQKEGDDPSMPIQGPACNSSNNFIGWHTFHSSPYAEKSAIYLDDCATVLPRKLEWSGFVMNSRLLWKDDEGQPSWMKDLDLFDGDEDMEMLQDVSVVEPLGSCADKFWFGGFVLKRALIANSHLGCRWIIDPPLEITIPSNQTLWPDAERSSMNTQEQTVKQLPSKPRTFRSKRSKRKREQRTAEAQVSAKQTETD